MGAKFGQHLTANAAGSAVSRHLCAALAAHYRQGGEVTLTLVHGGEHCHSLGADGGGEGSGFDIRTRIDGAVGGKERHAAIAAALEENKARAKELLEEVGLADKMQNYPCQLSGGQQQRVAIARALAQNPNVLCFDEPTSALDPELTGEVLRVIKELKDKGCTLLVVTHEMEFARKVADRVVFFADGVIEEEGTPEEFFSNPKSPKTVAFLRHTILDL